MKFLKAHLQKIDVKKSAELKEINNGEKVKVADLVITRQRPGTAKGFLFITLEDETGMINVVVRPKLAEKYRKEVLRSSFLFVSGRLEKLDCL